MTMRLTATLLKYGEDSYPDGWGDVVRFSEGALYLDDRQAVPLLLEHQQGRFAVGVAERIWTEQADDGSTVVRGEFVTLDTPEARMAEAELAAGIRQDVSVGVWMDEFAAAPLDPEDDSWLAPQRLQVDLAEVVETSLTLRGRMPSAQVDDVASTTDEGNPA